MNAAQGGKRVVVTGMGGISALGDDWPTIRAAMQAGRTAIQRMPSLDYYTDLNTRLGAPIEHFQIPEHYPRKMVRGMGRVSLLAVRATELALQQASLLDDPLLRAGRVGIAYGSSAGSVEPVRVFGRMLETGSMQGVTSTSYVQMMGHTCAVNVGLFFGLRGRVIPTSSACTSGSQGIGYAFESIRSGAQTVMIAGGAEEFSAPGVAGFDTLFPPSSKTDPPKATPRPFDRDRDGLVIGEGACTLILEEREHALARGATVYAEVLGFGTNSDGAHITQPEAETMAVAMQLALDDAQISADQIDWVNAHGTSTDRGDAAESHATRATFGRAVPITSLKSYFGHTLGACGALEAWLGIEMMRDGWVAPTANLQNVAPDCADLDYIMGAGREMPTRIFMNNNFAFGGINTSILFSRP